MTDKRKSILTAILFASTALTSTVYAQQPTPFKPYPVPYAPNGITASVLQTIYNLINTVGANIAAVGISATGAGVNVLSYAGADATGASDNSGAFNAAIATGQTVLVPAGTFHTTHMIALQNGQQMQCMGRTVSKITVSTDFSPTDPGVIDLGSSETGAGIHNCDIVFAQTQLQATRSNFKTLAQGCTLDNGNVAGTGCKYPPALYAFGASRFIIDHVRVEAAWDALNAYNSGGFFIDGFEYGAIDIGAQWDGGLDACHVHGMHAWPFGFTAGYPPVNADGQYVAAKIGRCDAQVIEDMLASEGQVHVTAPATLSDIQFDGTGSQLIVDQSNATGSLGPVKISNWQSSKGYPSVPSILVTAGKLISTNGYLFGGSTLAIPMISVTGGTLLLSDTVVEPKQINAPVMEVTGGTLISRGLSIDPFAQPYGGNGNQMGATFSAPLIAQVGPGVLDLQGTKIAQIGNTIGAGLAMFSDTPGNLIANNDFGGWAYDLPSTIAAGTYGPNRAPEVVYSPTIAVASGTVVPTYYIQSGRSIVSSDGYKFDMQLQFTSTFTGTGQLYIPLPYTLAARSQKAFSIGETIGLKLDTNFTQVSAVYDAAHNGIELIESGNNAAVISQALTTANLTSGGLVSLTVSGDVTAP